MFDHLFIDCRIATMTEGQKAYGAIEDAALAIKDGRIIWVGERSDLPSGDTKELSKWDGAWILPGLIDCHTHFIYAGSRIGDFESRNKGTTYTDIAKAGGGIMSTVRATRGADLATLVDHAMKRLQPFLAQGLTTIEIKSGYGLSLNDERKILQAATDLAKACHIGLQRSFLGAHVLPPEYADDADRYIDDITHLWLPTLVKEGLIEAVDGFCEKIAFSPAQIEKLFIAASTLKLPVKLHAEQLSWMGGTHLATRYQALSADHLEYAKESDIAAMAQSGTGAVLLPGAYYALREKQPPPIGLLRGYKVPIALASDHNPGTSPLSSLLPALNLAVILFGLTPEEALVGVTRNGARALGLSDRGIIEPGKRADLSIWQIEHPAELSYWIGGLSCHACMVDGVIR